MHSRPAFQLLSLITCLYGKIVSEAALVLHFLSIPAMSIDRANNLAITLLQIISFPVNVF